MKIHIVVDVQNDFTDGVLGSPEAVVAIPNIKARLAESVTPSDMVIFTRDTHGERYLETQEGKNLPVPHCIYNTPGWEIVPGLEDLVDPIQRCYINKPIFGSYGLLDEVAELAEFYSADSIEMYGFCTDICVISNALMLKSAFPEMHISVVADCCAGVTPAKHEAALEVMRSCQIDVI